MEVHFNQDLQAKLDKLAIDTGRAPDELVEDVVAAYLNELAQTRETLNSRYDDLKAGNESGSPITSGGLGSRRRILFNS
jgi:predicted transcriptional regulator